MNIAEIPNVPNPARTMVADLVASIERRELDVGVEIESTRALARRYKIGYVSAVKGLEALATAGYVRREIGKGTYVNDPEQRAVADMVAFLAVGDVDMYGGYVQGLADIMSLRDISAQVMFTAPGNIELAIKKAIANHCKGLVVVGAYNRELLERVRAADLQLVRIGADHFDINGCSQVGFQLEATTYNAVKRLIASGYSDIRYLETLAADYGSKRLRTGFLDGVRLDEASYLQQTPPPKTPAERTACAIKLVENVTDYTAFVANDHHCAFALLHACEQRGLRVPEDVAIVQIGDSMPGGPQFTTWAPAAESVGREAGQLLWELLSGRPARQIEVANQYRPGFSVRERRS